MNALQTSFRTVATQRDVSRLNPLTDDRWPEFLRYAQEASIFHTREWLEALRRTYRFEPLVFTTAAPGEALSDGIIACRIRTWFGGQRIVSMPFSDHCHPLAGAHSLALLLSHFEAMVSREGWRSIELRPSGGWLPPSSSGFIPGKRFAMHVLDVRPELSRIYRNFDRSCVQRRIRRAENAGLQYEDGNSEKLLLQFYQLLVITRQRHGVLPQPIEWFRNLARCFQKSMKIRVVSVHGRAVGSIITFAYKRTLVYKYGCSDARFHNLGPMPLLFWQAIQEAKTAGMERFDFGRSDLDNAGLAAFKENWGASRSTLQYWQFPKHRFTEAGGTWKAKLAKWIIGRAPHLLLPSAGRALYRYMS
jgi:hypothetical protein